MKKISEKFKLFIYIVLSVVFLVSSALVFNAIKSTNQPIYSQSSVEDNSGTEMVSGKVYSMPKSMTFSNTSAYSVNAQDGITVKATVKPDSLTNKAVSWSLSWVNAESDFAKGKAVSDYVELTSDSSTNTATIKCLLPFSEKVNLTATSTFDTSKSATCVIDYAKRITGIKIKSLYTSDSGELVDTSRLFTNDDEIIWGCDLLTDNKICNGFDISYSDIGTIVSTNYSLSVSRYFDYSYMEIINDYLNDITEINGETLDSCAELMFAEDYDGEWNGNLFDDIYIGGYTSEDELVQAPLTSFSELMDLLIDKYVNYNNGDISIINICLCCQDEFVEFEIEVSVYLEGSALNSYSVEVSLDNEGLVL